jgi:excisionase family DNA binding protein
MATRHNQPFQPYSLPADEAQDARASSATLAEFVHGDEQHVTVRLEDRRTGQQVEAPVAAAALRLLTQALAQMADGHAVTLLPLDAELSTQQAADLMGVSRPYFVKLLEEGRIPFRKVGSQRRVRSEALRRYLTEYQRAATQALAEMTAEAQRLGLYE